MRLLKFKVLIISAALLVLLNGCSTPLNIHSMENKTLNKSIENDVLQTSSNDIHQYLKTNYKVINPENNTDFCDLSIIDDNLNDKEIFFTGEDHGIKANIYLRMKFLKYFKEKTDFKYYLCELPYSDAYFLNKYLESGDKKILEEIYKPLKGTFEWNKDNYNHWKELYEFNKTLPEDRKIKIVAVDIEHQPLNSFKYMYSVLPKKEIPQEISELLTELKAITNGEKSLDFNGLKEFCEKLKKNIEENKKIYNQYLEDDYFGFKLVNDNILYMCEAYGSQGNDFNVVRDKRMYENFKQIYDRLPEGKYYGQWGLNHIFQKEQMGVKWIAAAMNDEKLNLNGKILSIAFSYDNCKFMSKNKDRSYSVSTDDDCGSLDIFSEFTKENHTIFKLNGKNSPFSKELIWPFYCDKPKAGVTTDFFQYIIVIKNSEASEPLNDQYD